MPIVERAIALPLRKASNRKRSTPDASPWSFVLIGSRIVGVVPRAQSKD